MKKTFIAVLVLILSLLTPTVYAADPVASSQKSLVVVHTTDVHSRVTNYPALASLVTELRDGETPVMVADSGDVFHGMPFANFERGQSISAILNVIKYDVLTIGNHDFNFKLDRLEELIGMTDADFVAANVIYDKDQSDVFTPYVINEYNGFRVGVIGLCMPETKTKTAPGNTEGISFADPVTAVRKYAAEIKDETDFIIVLSHVGTIADDVTLTSMDILKDVEGVDLVLDGHTHNVLEQKAGDGTVVGSGEYLNGANVVTITDGKLDNVKFVSFDNASKQDPAVNRIIEEIKAKQQPLLSQESGETEAFLNGERGLVRTMGTNLGNIVTDAYKYVSNADIAFENGGGIRASKRPGQITYGDVYSILPFGNYIATKELTGADIKTAIETGLTSIDEVSGGFLQVSSGLEVSYDSKAPQGKRLISITLNGEPIDDTKTYTVASNSYVTATVPGFAEHPEKELFGAADEALIKYLKENKIKKNDPAMTDIRLKDISKPDLYRMAINGVVFDANSEIRSENPCFVPLRKVAEAMGYKVEWDAVLRLAVAEKGETKIAISPDSGSVEYKGVASDASIEITGDTIYVDEVLLEMLFGKKVYHDFDNKLFLML